MTIGKGERLKLKCRDPGKKWCTKSAFWLGQLHSQQHHQQIRQENQWIVNTDWHYKNKFLPSKRLVGMVGEAAEGFLGRCRMIEHALYLIHFLSLVQLSTGRIQLCGCVWVHGESVGRGRGHCVHWLQRWEGGATLWQKIGSLRGEGAALTISFLHLLQKCCYQRGLFCGICMYHNLEHFLEFI